MQCKKSKKNLKCSFKSEDTGKFLHLQHKYSKSLSWAENLNKLFTVLGKKFNAQDSDLDYLCWRCKNSPVPTDLKPPLALKSQSKMSSVKKWLEKKFLKIDEIKRNSWKNQPFMYHHLALFVKKILAIYRLPFHSHAYTLESIYTTPNGSKPWKVFKGGLFQDKFQRIPTPAVLELLAIY